MMKIWFLKFRCPLVFSCLGLCSIFLHHTLKWNISFLHAECKQTSNSNSGSLISARWKREKLFAQRRNAGWKSCCSCVGVNRLRLGGCCHLESFGSCAGTSSTSLLLSRCAPMMFSAVLITPLWSRGVSPPPRGLEVFYWAFDWKNNLLSSK